MAVVLIATLDTKGEEAAFARDVLRGEGFEVLVIDAGTVGPPSFPPDFDAGEVRSRAGPGSGRLAGDRGEAVGASARGVAALVVELYGRGVVQGVLGLGGSAGTVIATAAMRALPFGLPKVMLSTLAGGQTGPFVGGSDLMMASPVADIAGLNRLTRVALRNASLALAGMVRPAREASASGSLADFTDAQARPLVAATMFGVTTPCVDLARRALEAAGVEVVVFHATGAGGRAMEGLIREGQAAGVLDLTTTELADELVGGILSAGPDRLTAGAASGLPQVVSVGALDMVNFGPRNTVPAGFAGRRLHAHNPSVTLMRTTSAENAALGARLAKALGRSVAPAVVLLPLRGVSALDAPGMPFHDPEADRALFDAVTAGLAGHPHVRVEARDEHINDPEFARAAAGRLLELMGRDRHRGLEG